MQFTCDTTQQVLVGPLAPTNSDGSDASPLDTLSASLVSGDGTFVSTSPTAFTFVSGTAEGVSEWDLSGSKGGVTVVERHSLLVTAVPVVLTGLGVPSSGTVQPKGT